MGGNKLRCVARRPFVPEELRRGPFTVAEAQSAGLSRKQLRGASWKRILGGLYAWTGLADNPALVLTALHRRLPGGAVFSGQTAGWLHGLDMPPADPVEVTVPYGCGVSARAGVCIRHGILSTQDIVERQGVPVTSPLRTAFDLARHLCLVEAVVAVDKALHSRLIDIAEFRWYVATHPRSTSISQARRVADLAEPASESAMETRLRMLLIGAGLPRPQAQVALYDDQGGFLARTDLYYPDHRLALEYDGGTHRESLVEDNRRQNRLLRAGYRLLRFTASDVYSSPEAIASHVRAVLRSTRPVSGNGPKLKRR